MNKAIGYIRAQSEEEGDNQQSSIFAWAMSNNIEVATFYRDIGTSAAHIENSPALAELLVQVEADSVESIIVVSQDRLARNYADWQKIIQTCEAHGCQFLFVEDTKQPDIADQIKAAFHQDIRNGKYDDMVVDSPIVEDLVTALEATMTHLRHLRDTKSEQWDALMNGEVDMLNQWDENKAVLKKARGEE